MRNLTLSLCTLSSNQILVHSEVKEIDCHALCNGFLCFKSPSDTQIHNWMKVSFEAPRSRAEAAEACARIPPPCSELPWPPVNLKHRQFVPLHKQRKRNEPAESAGSSIKAAGCSSAPSPAHSSSSYSRFITSGNRTVCYRAEAAQRFTLDRLGT